MMNDDEYKIWWKAQFPCSCGHSHDSHMLAPEEGLCLACIECHGEGGAIIRYSGALVEAAHKDEK